MGEGGREKVIEKIIRDYLKTKLQTNNVFLETPKTIASDCVIINIVDRSKENRIDAVTASVFSYGSSKLDAATLDERVRKVMEDFDERVEISACKLTGGSDSPDTALKKYRYRSNFNITYMEDY